MILSTRNVKPSITRISALFKGGGPLRVSAMVVGSAHQKTPMAFFTIGV